MAADHYRPPSARASSEAAVRRLYERDAAPFAATVSILRGTLGVSVSLVTLAALSATGTLNAGWVAASTVPMGLSLISLGQGLHTLCTHQPPAEQDFQQLATLLRANREASLAASRSR